MAKSNGMSIELNRMELTQSLDTTTGRMVIPAIMRQAMGINKGDSIVMLFENNQLVITKADDKTN